MVPEQAFHHRAQVGRRHEVAVLIELGLGNTRPVGDHTTALERAACQQRNGRGAVIGPLRAIDARGATEFRDQGHNGLTPGAAHLRFDRGNRTIERAEQVRQPSADFAFVGMGIPTIECKRADARTARLGQKFRRRSG